MAVPHRVGASMRGCVPGGLAQVAGGLLAVAALITCGRAEPVAPEPALPAPHGVVDLGEAGYLAGRLVPVPAEPGGRDTLLWQNATFTEPVELRLDGIRGVRFKSPEPVPAGARRVHLRGGDVISGTLVRLDDEALTLDLERPRGQRVRIARTAIESIAAPGAGGGSFDGPGGLLGWKQSPPDTWREEAGRLLGDIGGSAIARDVAAPPRARFDIVLSWRTRPEFRLVLATGEGSEVDRFWLEAIDTDAAPAMMLVRREGDAARIGRLPVDIADRDRLRLVLFVDQAAGRLAAIVPTADGRGVPAGDITLAPAADGPQSGCRLVLGDGDLCLESLRVTPWQSDEPTLDEAAGGVVVTTTDRLSGVTDVRFEGADAAAVWMIRRAEETVELPDGVVREVRLTGPAAQAAQELAAGLRLVLANGDRLSGDLHAIDARGLLLARRGIAEPVVLPYESLVVMQAGRAAAQAELPGREGTLTAEGLAMRGCLLASPGDAETVGVGWLPLGGVLPARFQAAALDGTIEYVTRDALPLAGEDWVGGIGGVVNQDPEGRMTVSMLTDDGAAARDGRILPGDRILAIRCMPGAPFVDTAGLDTETVMNLLRGRIGTPVGLRVAGAAGPPREVDLARGAIGVFGREVLRTALETHARFAIAAAPEAGPGAHPAVAYLRNGDVVRCRVERIEPAGVQLSTAVASADAALREVAAGDIQAIELVPAAPSRVLDAVRVERLLTVPRMQRERPPTHLLRLLDGDYVRGRLESLDAETARIEIHGTVQDVPRAAIARVIWLHPADDAESAAAATPAGLPVRAEWGDGRRLSLRATALDAGLLRGTSAALGEVIVPLDEVERLRLGSAAESHPTERPYAQWKLRPATLPRALRAADSDEPATPSP